MASFEDAIVFCERTIIGYKLHDEQTRALRHATSGRGVFCILPTGFGKSDVYMLAPQILDQMHPENKHVAVVVSPLRALMQDQVLKWEGKIACCQLKEKSEMEHGTLEKIQNVKYSVIFGSPEALLSDFWWGSMQKWRECACVLAIDEAHCIAEWGPDFREDYADLGRLRSLFKKAVPLTLTATATREVVDKVMATLHMSEETEFVTVVPNRTILHVMSVFRFLCQEVNMETAWVEPGGDPGALLVEMYHARVGVDTEEMLPAKFSQAGSKCRCIITTIAFGMGVGIPDVDYVIHWGPPSSILSYWQELGRYARQTGTSGRAIMYVPSGTLRSDRCTSSLIELVKKNTEMCIRKGVLTELMVNGMTQADVDKCDQETN